MMSETTFLEPLWAGYSALMTSTESVGLRVQAAVAAALAALPGFLGLPSQAKVTGARVEEVIAPQSPSGDWMITVSYLVDGVEPPEHPVLRSLTSSLRAPPQQERVYKIIEIDGTTGAAKAMRIRAT
jgi:hypothetical protein